MSLEDVVTAIEGLEVPVDGDALATALRAVDVLSAKVSEALGEFDARGLWDVDAATSLVAWLRDRGRMTRRQAAVAGRTATRLRSLPVTRAAWLDGRLSGGQVQAVVANVADAHARLFAEHESEVVPTLSPLTVGETAGAMRSWAAHAEAVVATGEPDGEPRRVLRMARTLDGRAELAGSLDAEGAGVIEVALRQAMTHDHADAGDRQRSMAERRGDALVDVCRWFLDHRQQPPTGRHRPHLNVIVRHDDVAGRGQGRLLDGTALDATTTRRMLCDAELHRLVVEGRSTVLDYGRRTRTVSQELFAVLAARDRHCRAPGCDRPPEWTEAHHVVAWSDGGVTSPENLVLVCSRHHHRFHQPRWHVELRPDATLVVTDPTGRVRTTDPPGW